MDPFLKIYKKSNRLDVCLRIDILPKSLRARHGDGARVLIVSMMTLIVSLAHADASQASAMKASQDQVERAPSDDRYARELNSFRGATVSLLDAIQTVSKLRVGAKIVDASFDGTEEPARYHIKLLDQQRLWDHAVDAIHGRLLGDPTYISTMELGAQDRRLLAALGLVRQTMAEAVMVAERNTSGRAISAGLVEESGALNFSVVIATGNDLKQVLLVPPLARRRP